MNYKEEDKKLIESANCYYYEFTEEKIKEIIKLMLQEQSGER